MGVGLLMLKEERRGRGNRFCGNFHIGYLGFSHSEGGGGPKSFHSICHIRGWGHTILPCLKGGGGGGAQNVSNPRFVIL